MTHNGGPDAGTEGGHDAPITSVTEDHLDALRTARAIHRVAKSSPPGWSTRIGLYGTWGSGKTSILNLLGQLEKSHGSIVVRFSAWSAAGEAGVIRLFYGELTRELTALNLPVPKLGFAKTVAEKGRWIGRLLRNTPKGTDAALGLPEGTASVVGAAADVGINWFRISRKDLETMVDSLGERRVTVFIDDLDRADPKTIPKSLLALRELLDWPRFTFVLAFDKRMIAKALSEYSEAYGENAELFLEKVIDVAFDVPHPTELQRGRLANAAFRACAPFIDDAVARAGRKFLPAEPRRVKQIARKLGVLSAVAARHDPGELDVLALVLLSIVQEASADLEAAAIALASDSGENWELLLGSRNEREEREGALRESLSAHLKGRTDEERDRAIGATLALMHRWSSASAEQIAYITSLVYDEPSFTRKEVRGAVNVWSSGKALPFEEAIAVAAMHSRRSTREAGLQFITIALNLYGESLEEMAGSETELERSKHANLASQHLGFLEHAFAVGDAPSFAAACKSIEVVAQLVGLVGRWAGWTKNQGEDDLRARERGLGLLALVDCDEPEEIFAATDPFWESHHDGKDSPSAQWRATVRAELLPRILHRLFEKFMEPEGVLAAARGEENLATWMLESTKSPVYTDPAWGERLTLLFHGEGLDDVRLANLRDNAKLYLHMLLHQARDSSWGGIEKVKDIDQRLPDLIPTAWCAVVSHPVPFRRISTLLKLKKDLVHAGVEAGKLNEPEWLLQAAAEWARTNAA